MVMRCLLLAAALVLAIGDAGLIPRAEAHPAHRSDHNHENQALWPEGDITEQRAALAADPDNLRVAISLATHYAEMTRKTGDERHAREARTVLAPWWSLDRPPVAVRLLRAALRQQRHDFAGALADIDAALLEAPNHPQAWLSKAMIHAVQGRPDEAAEACARLPRATPRFAVIGCHAHAGRLAGRAGEAYQLLAAHMNGRQPSPSPALQRWVLTIMAEISVQLGEPERAERHFLDAWALGVADAYLLAAYSDFLLDWNRPRAVVDLLGDESDRDSLLLRLAIAERQLGHADAEEHVASLGRRFQADGEQAAGIHGREWSRFALTLLDRPDEALHLALDNWKNQREPADARLVLEAAIAAGKPEAARPVIDWMNETGIEDGTLHTLKHQVQEMRSASHS